MGETEKRMPELSEERAAQILRNVFAACGMPENRTPFGELLEKTERYRRMSREGERARPGG